MKFLGILISTCFLCSCLKGTIKPYNIANFKELEVDSAASLDSIEEPKLIIVDFTEKHGVKGLVLSTRARSKIRQELAAKGVEFATDHGQFEQKLAEEIKIIEAGGTSKYKLRGAANVAMRAEITSADFYQDFIPAKRIKTDEGYVNIPEKCKYSTKVTGLVQFYKVNPVEKLKAHKYEGNVTATEEGRCKTLSQTALHSMYGSAVDDAARNARHEMMNVLARSGYVVAAYRPFEKEKPILYRLSIAPNDGAIPGNYVSFFDYRTGPNGQPEQFPVGEAKVACTNDRDVAYAMVKDDILIRRIKKNSPVKLKYTQGMPALDSIMKMFKCSP